MSDELSLLHGFYVLVTNLPSSSLDVITGCSLPHRAVYFFFEPGEVRSDGSPRVVRVGTHGVSIGSKASLASRLRQHRGTNAGGGNHRGSVFRLLVGLSIIERDCLRQAPGASTWSKGSSAPRPVLDCEEVIERAVSEHLRSMRVAWLQADDEPGPGSVRCRIESGSIRLLSSIGAKVDPPSPAWLGRFCPRDAVRRSGLWNIRDTDGGAPDRSFLDEFERLVTESVL